MRVGFGGLGEFGVRMGLGFGGLEVWYYIDFLCMNKEWNLLV